MSAVKEGSGLFFLWLLLVFLWTRDR